MTADTFAGSKVRHGTQSGWSMHKKLGERPCDPCYRAKQTYDQNWRSAPERVKRDRLHARAQMLAYRRLAHLYPDLYRQFYEEAKAQVFSEINGAES